ncbi:MAG: LysR family transcriptional regulator [Bacteroidota bacterium]
MITSSNQTELRHFRYFLALAESLHFRKAAEKLFISQPGLSRQIQQMEKLLGVQLFTRNNKQVTLTPAGQFLQRELQIVLQQLDQAILRTQQISDGVAGSLRIGYVGSAMQNIFPDLLPIFKRDLPGIQFSFQELDNKKQIDALLSKELDLGFVRLQKVPASLASQAVWQENFAVVVPGDFHLQPQHFRDITQLQEESFILFEESYSPSYYATVMSIFADHNFTPNVGHKTVHANTIFRLVENGFGISLVPSSLQKGYDLKVRFLELLNIRQRAILYMVWNKENANPVLPKIRGIVGEFS